MLAQNLIPGKPYWDYFIFSVIIFGVVT